jgi:hypothetical protein
MPAPPSYADLAALGALKGTVRPALGGLRDYAVGLLGATGNPPEALAALGALVAGHVAVAVTTSITAAHRGRVIDCTGTITINLLTAATAGNGFAFVLRNTGSGVVTIDPAGSETLDGAATVALPAGRVALILCTGTVWHSVVLPGTIGGGITQTTTDTTAGRLLTTGAGGLLGFSGGDANANASDLPTRFFRSTTPASNPTALNWHIMHISRAQNAQSAQFGIADAGSGSEALAAVRHRDSAGTWVAWNILFGRRNILGTCSQASGVPTGAIMESGSNANGFYTRFASGLMVCRHALAASSGAGVTWTFPSAFIAAPTIIGAAVATVLSSVCLDAAPGTTSVTFSARDKTDARRADPCHLEAVGRWF